MPRSGGVSVVCTAPAACLLLGVLVLPGCALAWTVSRDEVGVRMLADPSNTADRALVSESAKSRASDFRARQAARQQQTGGVMRRAMADEDPGDVIRRALLDFHNQKRSETAAGSTPGQPGSSSMNKLVWDPALAQVAQEYAEGCVWEHNPSRVSEFHGLAGVAAFDGSGLDSIGENIASGGLAGATDEEYLLFLAGLWFDECVRACVCACVRACVRACVCACVRARVRAAGTVETVEGADCCCRRRRIFSVALPCLFALCVALCRFARLRVRACVRMHAHALQVRKPDHGFPAVAVRRVRAEPGGRARHAGLRRLHGHPQRGLA